MRRLTMKVYDRSRIWLCACFAIVALLSCEPSSRSSSSRRALRLNEAMPRNSSTVVLDDAGAPIVQDWVEIFNDGSTPLSLAGFSLSDDLDRPGKFRFPPGAVIDAKEFVVVFVFRKERCAPTCAEERDACLAALTEPTPSDEAECFTAFDTCVTSCAPTGLTADFGFGAAETLYLFDGGVLVDRVGVRGVEQNVSVGRFPDGAGEFGVIYSGPTPSAPNMPTDTGTLAVNGTELSTVLPACGESADVGFRVTVDTSRVDEVVTVLDYTDLDSCVQGVADQPFTIEGVELFLDSVTPAPPDTSRVDINGTPLVVPRSQLNYRGVIPGAPCGTVRRGRVTVTVENLTTRQLLDCLTFGEGQSQLATLLVNEYVPINDSLRFFLGNRVKTPDWFEIHNFGTEAVDLSEFGMVSLGDWRRFGTGELLQLDPWRFIDPSVPYEIATESIVLEPGCFLVVLADNRDRDERPIYRLEDVGQLRGAAGCQLLDGDGVPYFVSTSFRLDATRRNDPDGFVLLDPSGRKIDLVEIRFEEVPPEFRDELSMIPTVKADVSLGRPSVVESMFTGELAPGNFLCTPTPGGDNTLVCDVQPRFDEIVTVFPRNPQADDAVLVRSQVSFDQDTLPSQAIVEIHYSSDPGEGGVVQLTGADLELATNQGAAAAASLLYDVEAEIPPQPSGSFVTFSLVAQDLALGLETIYDDRPDVEVSFQYLVGFERDPATPRFNEVLPDNETTLLPPFVGSLDPKSHDYVELFNSGGEPFDLSGYYLAQAKFPESFTLPVRRAREWRFPDGAIVAPGDVLTLYFGPPPDPVPPRYFEVSGSFELACEETLFLIAPDGREGGANSIVDTLTWDLDAPDGTCRADISFGRLCDAESPFAELVPTPDQRNLSDLLPPLFHSAFHTDLLDANNTCVTTSFVRLQAVVFVDTSLIEALDPATLNPNFAIDEAMFRVQIGDTSEETRASIRNFSCGLGAGACAVSPPGYTSVHLEVVADLRGGELPPVVSYEVELTDLCGSALAAGPFSFGTAAAERPPVAINELNRNAPLGDGSGVPRKWVELVNLSATETVAIDGLMLTDDERFPQKLELAGAAAIEPNGFAAFELTGEELSAFDLDGQGAIYLINSVANGSCVIDSFEFDFTALAMDRSLGRQPDGLGDISVLATPSPGVSNSDAPRMFLRGDANEDGRLNVTDVTRSLALLFSEESRFPFCLDALDADDSGLIDVADPVFLANFLFKDGPFIPPPYPNLGFDETPDSIAGCGP